MVDTNGFDEIEAAAKKAKTFFREGTWHLAPQWRGWVEYIIEKETSNINPYNILKEVEPKYISSRKLGIYNIL